MSSEAKKTVGEQLAAMASEAQIKLEEKRKADAVSRVPVLEVRMEEWIKTHLKELQEVATKGETCALLARGHLLAEMGLAKEEDRFVDACWPHLVRIFAKHDLGLRCRDQHSPIWVQFGVSVSTVESYIC